MPVAAPCSTARRAAAWPRRRSGKHSWVLHLAAGALVACAGDGGATGGGVPRLGAPVDLSHAFGERTVYWPTAEGFVLERGFEGMTEEGYWYAAHRFRAAEHGGTHMDAPYHFAERGATAEAVPLERLVGPALVVDVSAAAARDADLAVGPDAFRAFESAYGRIEAGSLVLLRTGWSARWPDPERYLGTARRGPEAVSELHFPGLGPEGARLLARRGVAAVGIDTASIDPGASDLFEAHRVLMAEGIPVFENLARLERLPPRGATVVALPMKIAGGTGAPLRAVAFLPADEAQGASGGRD